MDGWLKVSGLKYIVARKPIFMFAFDMNYTRGYVGIVLQTFKCSYPRHLLIPYSHNHDIDTLFKQTFVYPYIIIRDVMKKS